MGKLRPPIISSGTVRFDKEPSDAWITMTMPNGDTYNLHVDEMKVWMRAMRIDEDDSRSPLDRVWNFLHIEYNVKTMDFRVLLAEERMRAAG